jgi:hypothetical protein
MPLSSRIFIRISLIILPLHLFSFHPTKAYLSPVLWVWHQFASAETLKEPLGTSELAVRLRYQFTLNVVS